MRGFRGNAVHEGRGPQVLNTQRIEVQEGYVFEIELDFTSNRQRKQFQRNPEMFLAKKLNSSEVHWKNLNQEERRLMNNAKGGEVSSFLKTQAVRRCLTYEEQQEAQQSDRVLRARWVLVWKPVPEEDRAQAKADRLANPDNTVYDENLTRKETWEAPTLQVSCLNDPRIPNQVSCLETLDKETWEAQQSPRKQLDEREGS